MLEELIELIRQGGSFDTTFLAKRLNTTPEMVTAMIEHLQRSGIIKTYQPGFSPCEQCALTGACDQEKKKHEAGHLWMYEESTAHSHR